MICVLYNNTQKNARKNTKKDRKNPKKHIISMNNAFNNLCEVSNSREVNESYSHFYNERVFTFEENVVTDADVDSSILNLEEYNDYTKMEVNTKIPQEQVEIIDAINAQ